MVTPTATVRRAGARAGARAARLAAPAPRAPEPDHPTVLRTLAPNGYADGAPLLVQRVDQNFLDALLDELRDEGGVATVAASRARAASRGRLLLYQPVHRTFHVALLRAECETAGRPRLDPRKIESAGLVVRRLAVDAQGAVTGVEAWCEEAATPASRLRAGQRRRTVRGWVPLLGDDVDRDPDPERRPPPAALRAGHPEIARRLSLTLLAEGTLAERVHSVFTAPPDACAAAGRTILYGVLPLASAEVSERPPSFEPIPEGALEAHMPKLLQPGGAYAVALGAAMTYAPRYAEPVADFVAQLRQIAIELDAFGDSAESRALFDELQTLSVTYAEPTGDPLRPVAFTFVPFGDFLRDATAVLVAGDHVETDRDRAVRPPSRWPALTVEQARAVRQRAAATLRRRLGQLASAQPQYADATRLYQVRAFIRVRDPGAPACPPRLVWSDACEPFHIAPWFAPGEAPPVQIALPDAKDRDFLKALRPNVAFAVPKSLFEFMNGNDPKDLAKGEGGDGRSGIELDWICSFNIPIITLCAFIVLNVFLSLFDFFFRWMLFIKICIPFPKPRS